MPLEPDVSFHFNPATDLFNTKWIVPKGKQIKWGGWLLIPSTLVIRYIPTDYEIDLERIKFADDVYYWILYINVKAPSWAARNKVHGGKADIIADLVNAFFDLYPRYPSSFWDHHVTTNPKKYLRNKIKSREFYHADGAIKVVMEQAT